MEALLPSEIARLILGYLEDQKCTEAAKLFLETSPHLRECREVLLSGRRFSTRVNGLTLIDIVEKFSAINAMIQERLNKVTDCGQLKHCGDLIEQLKFLVEEPRGQRFVVNINVPSQSNTQTSNGSPIAANNMRKRRHSNSERIKRSIKSQLNMIQQSDIIMSPPGSCHNIDATPLESLPGNVDQLKQTECSTYTVEKKDDNVVQESHRQYDSDKNNSNTTHNRNNSTRMSLDDVSSIRSCEMDVDDKRKEENNAISTAPKQYTTSTSTEELLSFSSTEVQTIPDEIPQSETESNDEPIENLSILTKEILNRKELQECIAENINKAIIPTDLSLKDENLNESIIGEGNISIMAELNNAIQMLNYKSIVEATESDPVFGKFLNEFIGPRKETDMSPEEDGEGKLSPKSLNDGQEKQTETGLSNVSSPEPTIIDKAHVENGTADVPLKHRLRSSSRQQYNRIEDEIDKTRDQEKEQSALEDQNAAAILSIINANITSTVSDNDKKTLDGTTELITTSDDNKQKAQTMITMVNKNADLKPLTVIQKTNNILLSTNNIQPKVKKSTVKRPKPTKPKRNPVISDNQSITEQEIMTMPTLILCSKDEVNNLLINRSSSSTSRFIPIAPKDSNRIKESMETLYLRTVNVAQQLSIDRTLPTVIEESENSANQTELLQSKRKNGKVNKRLKTVHKADTTIPISVDQQVSDHPIETVQTAKIVGGESITLYANETSAKTLLDGSNMPTINLEENISLSESGLSPYIKFNCSKTSQSHNLSDIDLAPVMENTKNTTANNNGIDEQQSLKNTDIITKRTPKSLLKSRSKNHRLSLSTPRKRSSHIRALDFSTPKTSSTRKTNRDGVTQFSPTKRLKPVCRTSLFRSPSLSNTSAQKQKSPKVCQPYRIPIATRSPAPKLMGGWDKCNGVGVIIGEVSPHGSTSASCSSSDDRTVQHKPSKTIVDSWDADLRKSIQLDKKDETEIKKSVRRKDSIKDINDVIHKKTKYNSRSTKSKNRRKICIKAEIDEKSNHDTDDTNEPEENSQENMKIAATEKNCDVTTTEPRNNEKKNFAKTINIVDSITDKSKILESANTCKTSVQMNSTNSSNSNTTAEKKPVKKYAQLKTITTNIRKSENEKEKSTEDSQINSKMSEMSRALSVDSMQHFLRMPDMISLETPRKFDNTSGPPPTPRLLSPSSNIITPFIKASEDSTKMRSFIPTPEFPITPGVAITPKGETTEDIIKRDEYNSQYYKPTSEQAQNSDLKILKPKSSVQESPIISSSHITLQSIHNSLTSGNTYQTCTSSKLEITQFEVIKENLPREEAIKELKIASNSKDSTSADLNASVVQDQHDLIQINEFKGTSEHCEKMIDDKYVVDSHTDFVGSNSSSSSDTSSSSSSSSSSCTSTSSNTNSSRTCSPIEKCDKASSKTRTDVVISSNFTERSVNAPENSNVVTNDISMNVPTDMCKKSDNVSIKMESSPKKVFAITKTDEQIEATLKETPAKDEALLNEADISETPSGSKNGMEFLSANLSTKISAIMTEDEKFLKSNKSPKNSDKIKVNKSRLKPKIINVQLIRPASSKTVKPIKNKCRIEQEQSMPMYDKLLQRQQLEEKRQRTIVKIKDNAKLNISTGTKRKRILPSKSKASDSLKKSTRFGREKRNIQSTVNYSRKTVNKNVNKNTEPSGNLQKSSTINTRKKYESQTQNLVNKYCDKEKEMKNRVAASKNSGPNLTNCGNNGNKPVNDHIRQSHKNNVCDVENNIVENYNKKHECVHSHKNSLPESQECLKEKLETKEGNYSIKDNITKGGIGEMLKDDDIHVRISEKEINPTEKHISVQETSAPDKQEINDQTEDKINKPRQFANHADKSECYKILRYKVDQVKRDLFSDEENDHKTSSTLRAKDIKTKKLSNMETQNIDLVSKKNENATENPKQELSTVLQCLQLVPAHKNEQLHNDENQTEKQYTEQNEHENEADNESQQAVDMRNYKAEYHFVYDDSASVRKRRRRYSGHDLQIKINHADLSDPDLSNPVECIKVMEATEFEEIFNLPPKSKKRTVKKKSLAKISCETYNFNMDKDTFTLKDNIAKPLATSSPVDEPTKTKVRKVIIKTAAANKSDNDTQSDAKKKQKLDKPQVKDITAKSRKRKLSETKETKQIEKKPCTTDPQTLLSNFGEAELNNFLTAVHGMPLDMLSL